MQENMLEYDTKKRGLPVQPLHRPF